MHSKHLKILCLAICALTAFMAMSASAAQAKWLILRNKVSVTTFETKVTVEAGRLLVPALGLTIFCGGGEGTSKVSGGGTTTLSGTATITLKGCDVLEFEEVCSVRGSKDAVGSNKITTNGEGSASMTGSEVFLTASSKAGSPFTNIVLEGAECPFIEINGEMTGSTTSKIESPLSDLATHNVVGTSQSLSFGGNATKIENNSGGNLAGTATDSGGQTLAVHLRELPGCPEIC